MVKQYRDYVLTSMPPQQPWDWYCGCGNTEYGGTTLAELPMSIHDKWKLANTIDQKGE